MTRVPPTLCGCYAELSSNKIGVVPRSSDDALKRLGKRLRDLRRTKRLTQDEVAERAGFASGKYIGEVERGSRALPYLTLVKIVERGIGTSLESVFSGLPGRKGRPIIDVSRCPSTSSMPRSESPTCLPKSEVTCSRRSARSCSRPAEPLAGRLDLHRRISRA